jgi:SAM-dependent methyltransferase
MGTAADRQAIHDRIKQLGTAGDYGVFARYLEPGALAMLADWHITPGSRLLDVACGTGQIAIPAARAGVDVTGLDIDAELLAQARTCATAEGLSIQFDYGNAEQLPYPDASFDTVVSMVGAMFAPHPERVAAEFVRVCRSGGRIIMVNWRPTGFVGESFNLLAPYLPLPPNVPSPFLWGDEAIVRKRLRDGISDLQMTQRMYPAQYPFSVPEFVEFTLQYDPPHFWAFTALDELQRARLRRDMEQLYAKYNRATDGTASFEFECLEVIAVRR